MTRVALLSQDADLTQIKEALGQCDPNLQVFCQGQDGAHEAEIAVCWNPAPGALAQLKNLRLIHSIAAGVDHIYADPSIPQVPVCRVVDPALKRGMAEYVSWGVLHYLRSFDQVLIQQRERCWSTPTQRCAANWQVGVMGLGELGAHVAAQLALLGFNLRGWARSPKTLAGVQTWAGPEQLESFAQGLDCLICLIPLTPQTEGILNASLFAQLNHGAVLINCARGAHLVVDDLLAALHSGQLHAALLDVFDSEPLGPDNPLWNTRGVTITPHMASSASSHVIAAQVIENIGRLSRNEPLLNRVDGQDGY